MSKPCIFQCVTCTERVKPKREKMGNKVHLLTYAYTSNQCVMVLWQIRLQNTHRRKRAAVTAASVSAKRVRRREREKEEKNGFLI